MDFHLIDLPSQAKAVERVLAGRPEPEWIEWIRARGTLSQVPGHEGGGGAVLWRFEGSGGLGCVFFVRENRFVFLGDHFTYTADEL